MHLLIVTPLYPPATGGAATYFSIVVPALLERPEVERLTVLTEHLPGQPGEWTGGKLRIVRQLPAHVGLPRQSWWLHARSYALIQLWFVLWLPQLVRRLNVDLIHFHTRYRGRLLYGGLARSGVPVIANLHDKKTDIAALTRVADRLLCCGQGVQHFAVAGGFPAHRMVFVPLPLVAPQVPSSECVAALRRRRDLGAPPYVLFVGDITASKGVYELLEAYRRWRSDPPQARLVFIGINREGERFVQQIQHTPGATYLGSAPHEDALTLMRGAEVVALPSRSEGLPYVMLEAISMGAKIIAPPGVPELESHVPEAVLPEVSVSAIVTALTAACGRRDTLRYPLSIHDPHRVVSALVELYAHVIRDPGSGQPPLAT